MMAKARKRASRQGSKKRQGELVNVTDLVPRRRRDSLLAWFEVYMEVDGGAGADKTVEAKTEDLRRFAQFFLKATGGRST